MDGRTSAPPRRHPGMIRVPNVNTNKRYGFNHGLKLMQNGFRNRSTVCSMVPTPLPSAPTNKSTQKDLSWSYVSIYQISSHAGGTAQTLTLSHMAVGQNQWYHFGVGTPLILVYFSGIGMFTGGTGFFTHGPTMVVHGGL